LGNFSWEKSETAEEHYDDISSHIYNCGARTLKDKQVQSADFNDLSKYAT